MNNKAPLTLMEQLIMILVFALAAAICLRMFALANTISSNVAEQEQAVLRVQNTAEALKMFRGDFDMLAESWGGKRTEEGWIIDYDKNWEETVEERPFYTVEAVKLDDEVPLLGSASVTANNRNGKQLFQIVVSWQVASNE